MISLFSMTRRCKRFSERNPLPRAAERKPVPIPEKVKHGMPADVAMKDLLSGKF
jgi:hypothetical protein